MGGSLIIERLHVLRLLKEKRDLGGGVKPLWLRPSTSRRVLNGLRGKVRQWSDCEM